LTASGREVGVINEYGMSTVCEDYEKRASSIKSNFVIVINDRVDGNTQSNDRKWCFWMPKLALLSPHTQTSVTYHSSTKLSDQRLLLHNTKVKSK